MRALFNLFFGVSVVSVLFETLYSLVVACDIIDDLLPHYMFHNTKHCRSYNARTNEGKGAGLRSPVKGGRGFTGEGGRWGGSEAKESAREGRKGEKNKTFAGRYCAASVQRSSPNNGEQRPL